jgi:hypothetical protein
MGEGSFEEGFGYRVALPSNGNVALIGQARAGEKIPRERSASAWVFSRSGSVWSQQLLPLTCIGGRRTLLEGDVGCGAALSGDASTALVGTAVYVNSTQEEEEEEEEHHK